jgi:hypothetical protein
MIRTSTRRLGCYATLVDEFTNVLTISVSMIAIYVNLWRATGFFAIIYYIRLMLGIRMGKIRFTVVSA